MTLEEQKKLVAEKLMEWLIDEYDVAGLIVIDFITDKGSESDRGERINIDNWNPQSERKWWDDIWEEMDDEMFEEWITNIHSSFVNEWAENDYKPSEPNYKRLIQTAKPDVCWKALIKTLEE